MNDEETLLYDVDVPRIDLVEIPANKRKFAVLKSMEVSEMEKEKEVVTEGQDEQEVEKAEKKPEDYGYPKPEEEEEKKKKAAELKKAIEILKDADLTPQMMKAIEDLLEYQHRKRGEKKVEKSAEVVAVEKENAVLKDRLVALEKAMRVKDLEPICKDLGLDIETVWKAEQSNPEAAKYFLEKLGEARQRIGEVMKELGTSAEVIAPDEYVEAVEKAMKDDPKLTWPQAAEKVSKERPDLAKEYVSRRQRETR